MTNENMNFQNQNPHQFAKLPSPWKSSGLTKAGLILQILGGLFTLFLAGTATYVLITGKSIGGSWTWEDGSWTWNKISSWEALLDDIEIHLIKTIILTFIWAIVTPGSILCIVLSAVALGKPKPSIVITAGIFGIIFGWFLGGVLTLAGRYENQPNQNLN